MNSRKRFLIGAMLTGVCWVLLASPVRGQEPRPPMEPRPSAQDDGTNSKEGPSLPNPEKKILEENDKDMKKKVERLYELASELKDQVTKTDSSKVLSLDLVKKAEEIERLAREIKNRSKG
jgi:gas vesicle protein